MIDGHLVGEHAPGIQDPKTAYQVGHNLMVAHGLAVQAMRAVQPDLNVGIVLNLWPADPASDSPEDQAAAEATWQTVPDTLSRLSLQGTLSPCHLRPGWGEHAKGPAG